MAGLSLNFRLTYDNDCNWTLYDLDGQDSWEAGDTPRGEVATVLLTLNLPEVQTPLVTATIPQMQGDDGKVATVTIE
jgi:hypothetical protein